MAGRRKVVFDSGMLILLLQDGVGAPVNPKTKEPITRPKDRVEYLQKCLSDEKSKILIPTPALSEFLVNAGSALEKYVDDISNESCFAVVPFSEMAAIEAAVATYHAKQHRRTLDDAEKAAWQRVKIDIQILAIAKVNKVDVIYTTDRGVVAQAGPMGVAVIHLSELPLPPEDPQQEMRFDGESEPDSQAAHVRRSSDGPTTDTTASEGQAEAEEGEEG